MKAKITAYERSGEQQSPHQRNVKEAVHDLSGQQVYKVDRQSALDKASTGPIGSDVVIELESPVPRDLVSGQHGVYSWGQEEDRPELDSVGFQ